MDIAFDFSQNHKQSDAWRYLMIENNDKAVELLFGGAKYGGKSWFGCSFCFAEACRLIEIYKIKSSKFPIPVGFMGRKVARDFNDTTFETWKKCIPQDAYVIKGNPPDIIIANAVKIITGGLDRSEDIQKFNSAELAFYFIDQAEETDRNDVMALRAATFWRLSLGKRKVPGKGLLTANPAQCWLKEEFIIKAA